jgi:hypothetical protein
VSLSPDARVLIAPARAFEELAARRDSAGVWTMLRRPLFLAFVIGCVSSILTSGALNARLMWSVPIYWSFVPITEIAALLVVTAARRHMVSRASAVDGYFTGHAAWTLFLLAIGLTLSSVPVHIGWRLIITAVLGAGLIVLLWSAYTDYWFFRTFFEATHRRAIRDTALMRLVTWPIVFIIFAVPVLTPWALAAEIGEMLREIF